MENLLITLNALIHDIFLVIDQSPLIGGLFFLCTLFLGLIIGRLTERKKKTEVAEFSEGLTKLNGLLGKLARLEETLNNFRTDSLRTDEMIKRELYALRSAGKKDEFTKEIPHPEREKTKQEADASKSADTQVSKIFTGSKPSGDVTEKKTEKSGLFQRLTLLRSSVVKKLSSVFSETTLFNDDFFEELEAQLISADLGAGLTKRFIDDTKTLVKSEAEINEEIIKTTLKERIRNVLNLPLKVGAPIEISSSSPYVVLVVGVNGVGKTTTIAKLASKFVKEGKKVLLVAGDTFRAAAVEQLKLWGEKVGATVVSGAENAKPQTVIFDGMKKAKEEGYDIVFVDTAGRLQAKTHLMQELEGVKNAIKKHVFEGPHETFIVVDAATGQNALLQAKEFHSVTPLTGLIVTKLDGTPKGGILVAISDEVQVPVRYIGIGEAEHDLRLFNTEEFINAMLDDSPLTDEGDISAHAKTRLLKAANGES